ncbi:succinate--hydroxymethylglutarate CoA-transferase isoform X3 [Callorhinchus milii]|uniref:succinate--hydroxymethylglutarate CoA-transferase isoform X3 n=1 Tax=Callorhinchus milii TaxID=7868 RepID=UPI001C3F7F48|nr:succinate--hydroxymethylglutarate CoA-transferase isoform X3 [Callorhinchus milii]
MRRWSALTRLLSFSRWRWGAAAAAAARGSRRPLSGAQPSGHSNVKPLEGIKVLDLTRVLAGPFATMILGDLGAEVIKVEKKGSGDDTRAWGPPFVETESVYFLSVNRNKKSISVNLKDPKGAHIIKDLASVCDVLIENYTPGKLGEMGLGYEDIHKIAPHIVYCSISGYGQTGPMSQRPGYDSIACAMSGLMHITGSQDGDPVRPGVAMTDLATGLYAHGAIMAGLLQKEKTGKGLHIDCNLLSSQVACLTHIAANYLTAKKEAKKWGTAHESIVPYQVIHNDLILEMEHPTAGTVTVPGPAVRFSDFKVSRPEPPPLIGQHTVEVLKTVLGYSESYINELLTAGAVTQHELH